MTQERHGRESELFSPPVQENTMRSRCEKMLRNQFRTDTRKNIFTQCIIDLWSSLSLGLVMATGGTDAFKIGLSFQQILQNKNGRHLRPYAMIIAL